MSDEDDCEFEYDDGDWSGEHGLWDEVCEWVHDWWYGDGGGDD